MEAGRSHREIQDVSLDGISLVPQLRYIREPICDTAVNNCHMIRPARFGHHSTSLLT